MRMQSKALRRGVIRLTAKINVLKSKDCRKGDYKKSGSRIKAVRRVEQGGVGAEDQLDGNPPKKRRPRIERKTPMLRIAFRSTEGSLCGLRSGRCRG